MKNKKFDFFRTKSQIGTLNLVDPLCNGVFHFVNVFTNVRSPPQAKNCEGRGVGAFLGRVSNGFEPTGEIKAGPEYF